MIKISNLMMNLKMKKKMIQFKNICKVIYLKLDEFEINEIDEDLYNESNCEILSNKNYKN
jgi:hypothetical protein